MNILIRYITAVFVASALAASTASADSYSDATSSFRNAGQSGQYFDTAYGYALFPTIGKGGVGVGGAHGKGKVYIQGQYVGDSTMTQLTVGLQIGGQAFSQVIFFQDRRAYEEFVSGQFEFGAQATAVAITAGVSAEATTGGGVAAGVSGGRNDALTASPGYRKGMAIFTIARGGLMYEASLGGQKFKFTPVAQ
ncbi:MAG: YSC84-related protein [Parahaliea sp.]